MLDEEHRLEEDIMSNNGHNSHNTFLDVAAHGAYPLDEIIARALSAFNDGDNESATALALISIAHSLSHMDHGTKSNYVIAETTSSWRKTS
jgi:hypothetical protein